MRRVLLAPFLALLAAPVAAGVIGNASIGCSGYQAVLSVIASASPADTGRPGAWFIAAHHPTDATRVAFLTPEGWKLPSSAGELIPYGVYEQSLPGSISTSACVPSVSTDEYGNSMTSWSSCATSTANWNGYVVKVGYGVLTPLDEQLVATRRERLDAAKPIMIEKGKWREEYEDDDRMRQALVIKSMREDSRIADVLTVYPVECFASP